MDEFANDNCVNARAEVSHGPTNGGYAKVDVQSVEAQTYIRNGSTWYGGNIWSGYHYLPA